MFSTFDSFFNGTKIQGRALPRQWMFPFVLLALVLWFGPTSPPKFDALEREIPLLFQILTWAVAAICIGIACTLPAWLVWPLSHGAAVVVALFTSVIVLTMVSIDTSRVLILNSYFWFGLRNLVLTVASLFMIGSFFDFLLHRLHKMLPTGRYWLFWIQVIAIMLGTWFFFIKPIWNEGMHAQPALREWNDLAIRDWPFPHLWFALTAWAFFVLAWGTPLTSCLLKGPGKEINDKLDVERDKQNDVLRDFVIKAKTEKKQTSLTRSIFDCLGSPVEYLFPPALFIVLVDIRAVSSGVETDGAMWLTFLFLAVGVWIVRFLLWARRPQESEREQQGIRLSPTVLLSLEMLLLTVACTAWLFFWWFVFEFPPGRCLYYTVAFAIGLTAFILLVESESSVKLAALRTNVRRVFWFGGSFLTTFFVILLAVLWLLDVGYVTTVLEGSRLTVAALIFASYALFWNIEYWKNYVYSASLLRVLGEVHDNQYVIVHGRVVHGPNYYVCIHGTAKLAILKEGEKELRIFDRSEFFEGLLADIWAQEDAGKKKDEKTSTRLLKQVSGRAKTGFVIMDFAFFFPVVVLGLIHFFEFHRWWLEGFPPRAPIVSADLSKATPDKLKAMESLLFDDLKKTEQEDRPQVILIAASGGGTRAALYASSALDGLRLEGKIRNVRAVSGVSGGGVALAYFAAHHDLLVGDDKGLPDKRTLDCAWDRYHKVMAKPYFIDVLRGAPEFRVTYRTSISSLLPESFDHHFYGEDSARRQSATLGNSRIGVLFNTTLVGESRPPFSLMKVNGIEQAISDDQVRRSEFGSGLHAGSRVVFTNLNEPGDFPNAYGNEKYPWNEVIRYVVINDPTVPFTRGASLNANFPPVFPNAPVDVTDATKDRTNHRYWVTDGGAEENRGQVSLMYAVRGAIKRSIAAERKLLLPDIHLVVVEASAGSVQYKQDYGTSAFGNSAQKLANQLALELENDINRLYKELHARQKTDAEPCCAPRFKTHYLPMPSAYRIDGGVGTHWMMPEIARLAQPTVSSKEIKSDSDIYVDRDSLQYLIRRLHNPGYSFCCSINDERNRAKRETIDRWRREDPLPCTHEQAWDRLLKDLGR